MFQTLLPYIYEIAVLQVAKKLRSYDVEGKETNQLKFFWIKFCENFKFLMESTYRFHLAIFYFSGNYYEFSKRILHIRYIFNNDQNNLERRPKYHILGILIIAQFLIQIIYFVIQFTKQYQQPSQQSFTPKEDDMDQSLPPESVRTEESSKCSLCLESFKNTTATQCGHIFCWECIAEWCNSKSECPLCRKSILPSTLMRLYNY